MSIESFIKYDDSYLIRYAFDISDLVEKCDDKPSLEGAKSNLDIKRGMTFDHVADRLTCSCKLDVEWRVVFQGERGPAELRAECGMVGGSSCAYDLDSEDILQGILAPNTIVFLWGKIRDMIEMSSLMSPLGKMTLPAIDPMALLEESGTE